MITHKDFDFLDFSEPSELIYRGHSISIICKYPPTLMLEEHGADSSHKATYVPSENLPLPPFLHISLIVRVNLSITSWGCAGPDKGGKGLYSK